METVIFVGIFSTAVWALYTWAMPLKRCPRCGGSKRLGAGGVSRRRCGRCGGVGEVRRVLAPLVGRGDYPVGD